MVQEERGGTVKGLNDGFAQIEQDLPEPYRPSVRNLCGAQIRSESRRALVFVQKPAEAVATVYDYRLHRVPRLKRLATVRR